MDKNDIDYINWNIAMYGGPILVEKEYKVLLGLDEMLIIALEKGRLNPRINTILPVLIFKNKDSINIKKLIAKSDPQFLGYMLDLVNHCAKEEIFETDSNPKYKEVDLIIEKTGKSEYYKKCLKYTDNVIAKKWGFKTLSDLLDIERRFNKWNIPFN